MTAETTPTGESVFVFDSKEGVPTSIEVTPADGTAVKVVRSNENSWVLELPDAAEADQGITEAAATQLSSLSVISAVQGDPEIFGFDKPAYIITIEFKGGKKHTLEVGDNTPTNSGYYVRLDNDKMMVVGLSGIDALTNLVTFPPYLNTPTPSPLPPTETPAAPVETPTSADAQTTVTPTP